MTNLFKFCYWQFLSFRTPPCVKGCISKDVLKKKPCFYLCVEANFILCWIRCLLTLVASEKFAVPLAKYDSSRLSKNTVSVPDHQI